MPHVAVSSCLRRWSARRRRTAKFSAAWPLANAAFILAEGHVEHPEDRVLDAPMAANRFPEPLRRERGAQQVVARLALAVSIAPAALGLESPMAREPGHGAACRR